MTTVKERIKSVHTCSIQLIAKIATTIAFIILNATNTGEILFYFMMNSCVDFMVKFVLYFSSPLGN